MFATMTLVAKLIRYTRSRFCFFLSIFLLYKTVLNTAAQNVCVPISNLTEIKMSTIFLPLLRYITPISLYKDNNNNKILSLHIKSKGKFDKLWRILINAFVDRCLNSIIYIKY